MIQLKAAFAQYYDSDGSPLDGGYVYFGQAGQNPETHPVVVYSDFAATQPIAQPLRTSAGVVLRNGSPSRVYAPLLNYSVTVKNKRGAVIFSALDYAPESNEAVANTQAVADAAAAAAMSALSNHIARLDQKDAQQDSALLSEAVLREQQISNIAASFTFRGDWVTGSAYNSGTIGSVNDPREIVRGPDGVAYVVMADHTSGVFLTDVAAGRLLNTDAAQTALDVLMTTILGYGVVGDGVTDNTTALQAAASSGRRLYCPPGVYLHGKINFANNTEFYGPRSAVFQQANNDEAHFYCQGLSWFRVAGVTLKGRTTSTGVTGVNDRAAIVVANVNDFEVDGCLFEQHAGSGVTISRQGLYVNRGAVRNCVFIKGDMTATGTAWGTQDNAPVAVYQYGKNIEVSGNRAYGRWYSFCHTQDLVSNGESKITGMNVHDNYAEGLETYGLVMYTVPSLVVNSITDNGSGLFRVGCTTDHKFTDGEKIHLTSSGTASGIWEVSVVSPTAFDLVGSVFVAGATTGGDLRPSENCAGTFNNNVFDTIHASREFAPGNKPYGSAIYVQGAGGITGSGNVMRNTGLETNSETLAPGAIGINMATGPIHLTGGSISDTGYSAVSIKNTNGFGPIFVGGGLKITRPTRDSVRVINGRNVIVDGVDVHPGPASLSGRVRVNDVNDLVLKNIVFPRFDVTASSNAFEIDNVDRFEVSGCRVVNVKPAAQTFEALRILNSDFGIVMGNMIDGGASAFTAARFTAVTNTLISNNLFRMTADGAARETVSLIGTCTGTVYELSNQHFGGRMSNASTGGAMHTRESTANSGGKTRQAGDTITNTNPGAGGVAIWVKTAASAGGTNWQGLTLA